MIGAVLRQFRARSGLSLRQIATAAGYKQASSIQRYFDDDYDPIFLPRQVAERLAKAFEGTPVDPNEVLALAGSEPNAKPFQMEGASAERMAHDVPIYGTALGADEIIDGEAIEQTMLNSGETVGYLRRPVLLDGRADIYGLYVQGSSMAPRYRDGATIFVEQRRPARVGDDVVVYLRVPDEHDGERESAVLVKTLVRKTAAFVELEQYTPGVRFKLPTERVSRIDRVVPWDELVA